MGVTNLLIAIRLLRLLWLLVAIASWCLGGLLISRVALGAESMSEKNFPSTVSTSGGHTVVDSIHQIAAGAGELHILQCYSSRQEIQPSYNT